VNQKFTISAVVAVLMLLFSAPYASAKGDKGQKGGKHSDKAAKHADKAVKHEGKATSGTFDRDTTIHRERARTDTARTDTANRRDTARRRDVPYVVDRDGNRRIVTDYYSRQGLPPGLAKRDSLPPGLAKQLRERGTLPPGLQKRLTPVPYPLARQFPARAPYYSRYFAGRDLIVIDRRTNRIVEIIPDALPR
jgi:hypothetical protein